MKNIVNKEGDVIAKTTDDGSLIGGHHRLSVAASIGQHLFWQHTGKLVTLDASFFKHLGRSHKAPSHKLLLYGQSSSAASATLRVLPAVR